MARTRKTAAKEKDGNVETMDVGVLEQPKARKPAKSSPRKRKAANKEENQETVKVIETKKTARGRTKKSEETQVKMDDVADEIPPKRGRKTAKGKTSTGKQNKPLVPVIVEHNAYFSPDESMEPEFATSNNSKGRESNYHSADENLSESRPSSAASNATFTFETEAQKNNVDPEIEKAKRLKARGKKEERIVAPASSPAGSTTSGATFTLIEGNKENKENINAKKTKVRAAPKTKSVQMKLGSNGPMTPGERYREAHEKIDAAGENIGERRERIAKHREAYAKETKGTIFERLATPKAVTAIRNHRRPPTNNPGYDFGDGKQMAAFNFGFQVSKAKDVQKAGESTAPAKTVKTRPIAAQKVGVKELTRQSKIPLAVRREAKKVEQAVVRQEVHFINRQIITPKLTRPTNNPTINRLATPKSELRTGEATRLAKEGRIFKRVTHAHPFVDTSNLNDKQYRQAVELGLISKQDGQMVFHDENYQELLENAPNKRELQLLHDIHMKIKIKN